MTVGPVLGIETSNGGSLCMKSCLVQDTISCEGILHEVMDMYPEHLHHDQDSNQCEQINMSTLCIMSEERHIMSCAKCWS